MKRWIFFVVIVLSMFVLVDCKNPKSNIISEEQDEIIITQEAIGSTPNYIEFKEKLTVEIYEEVLSDNTTRVMLKIGDEYETLYDTIEVSWDGEAYKKDANSIIINNEYLNKYLQSMEVTLYYNEEIIQRDIFKGAYINNAKYSKKLEINDADINNVKYLWVVNNEYIQDISCLTNAKNLESIYFAKEMLVSDITELCSLTNLKEMRYVFNELEKTDDLIVLSELRALTLVNVRGIEDLSFFNSMKKLEYLYIESYYGDNYNFLDGLTSVNELTFVDCQELSNSVIEKISDKTNIRKLIFDGCNMFSSVESLRNLKNIEVLKIIDNTKLNEVSFIDGLRNLRVLYLVECENIKSLPGFNYDNKIEKLCLQDLYYISELNFLDNLSNLTYIKIEGMKSLYGTIYLSENIPIKKCILNNNAFDISGIVSNPNLTELKVTDSKGINSIKNATKLRKLYIGSTSETEILDLSFISELVFLESIDIEAVKTIRKVPLKEVIKLTNFSITGDELYNEIDISELSNAKNLERLVVSGACYVSDISFLSNSNNLKYLDIHMRNENDFSPLTNLTSIEMLKITCNNFVIPQEIDKLVELEELWLSDCSFVNSNALAPLSKLKELKILNIWECNCIVNDTPAELDFSFISDMTKLESLTFCNSVPEIRIFPDVGKLKYLKILNFTEIGNTDINNIWEAKNLEQLLLTDGLFGKIDGIIELSELKIVTLNRNNIIDFTPILSLTNLKYMELIDNNVDDTIFRESENLIIIYN